MRKVLAVVLVLVLVLPTFAGVAAAQSQQRVGGTVVVEEGERINGLTVYGGRVVVRGTVQGDLTAFTGRVVIAESGVVTGRVRAFTGSVEIAGTVRGNVVAYAGQVNLAESGQVNGSVGALGGGVFVAGSVRGDVTTVAGSTTLAPTAEVSGDLTYTGAYTDQGGTVSDEVRHVSELSLLPPLTGPGSIIFTLYLLFADAFAGALFLYAFPAFSRDAVETTIEEPLRVGLAGVAAAVAVPVTVVVAALTIVGIPLALAGLMGYVVLVWVGSVYGRYLVGTGLLSYTDLESRYLALVVGIVLVGILTLIPILGPIIRLVVALLGVGVVTLGLYAAYESVRERRRSRSPGDSLTGETQ